MSRLEGRVQRDFAHVSGILWARKWLLAQSDHQVIIYSAYSWTGKAIP